MLITIAPVCYILEAIFCSKTLWNIHYRTNIGCCERGWWCTLLGVKYYALGVAYLWLTHFLEHSHLVFFPPFGDAMQVASRNGTERCPGGNAAE
jgi:hypothetical protein